VKKTEKENYQFKGIDFLILAAIALVLITVGIRFYIAWNADWSSIFKSMTAIDWIISIIVLGLIEFVRRKWK
jgi:hypothetical protein